MQPQGPNETGKGSTPYTRHESFLRKQTIRNVQLFTPGTGKVLEDLREDWTCPTEPPLKIKSLLLLLLLQHLPFRGKIILLIFPYKNLHFESFVIPAINVLLSSKIL